MATDSLKSKDHLLPLRHGQDDLFLCDVSDAVLKDIMPQMEHPFFSLSKNPEKKVRRYEHNGNWIEIKPSTKGLATIYDKDILIYCISQIMMGKSHMIRQYLCCAEATLNTDNHKPNSYMSLITPKGYTTTPSCWRSQYVELVGLK